MLDVVLPEPTVFTGAGLLDMMRPVVYVLRDAAQNVLYVGFSGHGMARVLDRKHKALGILLEESDQVEVYFFDDGRAAYQAEQRMIADLVPSRNRNPVALYGDPRLRQRKGRPRG